jgi:hypothetical protein
MIAIPPFLEKILPVLKIIGIDPSTLANKFGREQVKKRVEKAIPAIVERLEKDKLTPAAKAATPEGEALFVSAAMYNIAKAVANVLPFGANVAADYIRDQHRAEVRRLVEPQITAQTTTEAAVILIAHEFIERVF